jgi:hypothetical protein
MDHLLITTYFWTTNRIYTSLPTLLRCVDRMKPLFGLSLLAAVFQYLQHAEAFAITGILAGVNNSTGERPLRLAIEELYQSGPGWDLFVLALAEFQNMSQDDPLSYYQVAGKTTSAALGKLVADLQGIHGLPRATWDGVEGLGDTDGYCTHAAVTFPTWHRPYVALFEVRAPPDYQWHLFNFFLSSREICS